MGGLSCQHNTHGLQSLSISLLLLHSLCCWSSHGLLESSSSCLQLLQVLLDGLGALLVLALGSFSKCLSQSGEVIGKFHQSLSSDKSNLLAELLVLGSSQSSLGLSSCSSQLATQSLSSLPGGQTSQLSGHSTDSSGHSSRTTSVLASCRHS